MIKFYILLFLLVTSNHLFANCNDSLTKNIRVKYNYIKTNLNSFDTTIIEIWGESTEGGQQTAFYEDSELKLIQVVWLKETGKNIIEYYFDNGQLIFAFDQVLNYNMPIYWDEKKVKENQLNIENQEVFDPKKTIILTDRYYFNNEILFLWLNNDKKEVDLKAGTNVIVGLGLVSHCQIIKDKFVK